jgi:hypothetical protein
MSTINGIGTKFMRETEIDKDGFYIATNWFVIGQIPLIPLAAFKVYEEISDGDIFSRSTKYKVTRTSMNIKHLLPIISIVWISILLLFGLFTGVILISNSYAKLFCVLGIILVISIGAYKLSYQDYIDISND